MKRNLVIAALALGGSLTGLALTAGATPVPHLAVGEMHTVLLDASQMPPSPTTTTTTTATKITKITTTTTTQPPPPPPVVAPPPAPAVVPATPNPVQDQAPPSPSQCLLWVPANTEMNPNPTPELIYGGSCTQANAFAAANPPEYVTPQS